MHKSLRFSTLLCQILFSQIFSTETSFFPHRFLVLIFSENVPEQPWKPFLLSLLSWPFFAELISWSVSKAAVSYNNTDLRKGRHWWWRILFFSQSLLDFFWHQHMIFFVCYFFLLKHPTRIGSELIRPWKALNIPKGWKIVHPVPTVEILDHLFKSLWNMLQMEKLYTDCENSSGRPNKTAGQTVQTLGRRAYPSVILFFLKDWLLYLEHNPNHVFFQK